jgi:hypothetical protein
MLARPLERPKNRWEDNKINDIKKLKIKIGLAASRITISGNYRLRRPKDSKNKVVAPKEDEEEEEEKKKKQKKRKKKKNSVTFFNYISWTIHKERTKNKVKLHPL